MFSSASITKSMYANWNTVLPLLQATASNYSDEFFAQHLLSKKCILVRLLFEGGFYSRAASNNGNTVVWILKGYCKELICFWDLKSCKFKKAWVLVKRTHKKIKFEPG